MSSMAMVPYTGPARAKLDGMDSVPMPKKQHTMLKMVLASSTVRKAFWRESSAMVDGWKGLLLQPAETWSERPDGGSKVADRAALGSRRWCEFTRGQETNASVRGIRWLHVVVAPVGLSST
ncbi:hypothetical protein PHYPSEUDO_004253 [Phytophthora pseudosyringae]|uniref:Uncharacterized protein n=1 Tax=Phytophthora pseudosyringae TaxID=221518 RepID=A0A8T1VRN3_9STRA|nr:hypothetical protein PHYPSEUDO_004253 [Phytophthora pseudosyringae]